MRIGRGGAGRPSLVPTKKENCFADGIGGMTTGTGSITGGTLWNGKKKTKRNIVLICKVTTAYIYIQYTNTLIVSSTMGNATFES